MADKVSFLARIQAELQTLEESGNLRTLRTVRPDGVYLWHNGRRYLNLSSNDYLGLSASPYASLPLDDCYREVFGAEAMSGFAHGNPASRLMTGNSPEYEALESGLQALFPGRAALALGCGYMVNSGLMPALASKDDLILADKLVHASIIEGLQHIGAEFRRFRHNDANHLEHLLQQTHDRQVWVIIESIYSMDGDLAPLREIVELKQRYGFRLYVDEAHAFATCGPQGAGYCAQEGLGEEADILVCTFGKALAGAGACVICHPLLKRYLINKMRPLIFSTALPPATLRWDALMVHELHTPTLSEPGLPPMAGLRQRLSDVIALFNTLAGTASRTAIIPLPAGSNERALQMAADGARAGYWLTAIRHPTVARGSERIRLSLHAGLSDRQITLLTQCLCKKPG